MTAFLKGWFDRHAFGAVSTKDLERELSESAGKDLSKVFEGFVYGAYHPEVKVAFAPVGNGEVEVTIEQTQSKGPANGFVFPLDLDFVDDAGRGERVAIDVDGKRVTKRVRLSGAPKRVVVDPDEYLVGTVGCDAGQAAQACKDGYRCSASQCVP
jgi:aminopeptidase N